MKYKDAYIGQRVVWLGEDSTHCHPSGIQKGDQGVILTLLDEKNGWCIGVKWDCYVGGHTLHGKTEDGYGYFMYPQSIDSIDDEFPEKIKVTFDDMFEGSE